MRLFGRRKEKETRKQTSLSEEDIDALCNNKTKQQFRLSLGNVTEVKKFSDICQTSPVTVTLCDRGGITVAGDSIMGIFAISLLEPLKMTATGQPADIRHFVKRITDNKFQIDKAK